jgi:hypothetical protein
VTNIQRRTFLGGVAAAGLRPASPPAATLPVIRLGDKRVTRLIAGGNPIGGYAYAPPKLSRHMQSHFTVEQTARFLLDCERQGIDTFQSNLSPTVRDALRLARDQGSKIQFILLDAGYEKGIPGEVLSLGPIAISHHGGVTDRLFRSGQHALVRDFVKRVHDAGMLAGVSMHNPDHLAWIEDVSWENDFYMACFYNLTRTRDELSKIVSEDMVDDMLFFTKDPERMTKRIREAKKPCLGFKILAAGRYCRNSERLERAFRYAFENIKPTDGVIVGMYPVFSDEAKEDADLVRNLGAI